MENSTSRSDSKRSKPNNSQTNSRKQTEESSRTNSNPIRHPFNKKESRRKVDLSGKI
jgi:hypothetical protein